MKVVCERVHTRMQMTRTFHASHPVIRCHARWRCELRVPHSCVLRATYLSRTVLSQQQHHRFGIEICISETWRMELVELVHLLHRTNLGLVTTSHNIADNHKAHSSNSTSTSSDTTRHTRTA